MKQSEANKLNQKSTFAILKSRCEVRRKKSKFKHLNMKKMQKFKNLNQFFKCRFFLNKKTQANRQKHI